MRDWLESLPYANSDYFKINFYKTSPKNGKIQDLQKFHCFSKTVFLHELHQKLIQGDLYRSDDPYFKLTEIFSSILNKDAPIKSKEIRGNQTTFMNKSLNKTIMQKSKVRNKYLKWLSSVNFLNYKKVKNKCNSLVRKSKKEYFQNVSNANSSHSK